ncbi:MAG: T9SS type A sorting domain-containing protein, partial [Bacteroidota bacterium]
IMGAKRTSDLIPLCHPLPITDPKDLEPDEIKSIDVLKGESATAIYGNDGLNGVVVITLKDSQRLAVKEDVAQGLRVYPNSFSDVLNVEFELLRKSKVKMELLNLNGQRVISFNRVRKLNPGLQTIEWRIGGIAEGNYILRIEADGQILEKQVVYRAQ